MAEVLGLGITHYPLLAAKDEYMATSALDPDRPRHPRGPEGPGELVRAACAPEWGDDQGGAAARRPPQGAASRVSPAAASALDEFSPTSSWCGATTSTRTSARRSSRRSASWPTTTPRSHPFEVHERAWASPTPGACPTTRRFVHAGQPERPPRHLATDAARRRLRRGLLLPPREGTTLPARLREHPALPRLRQRRHGVPVPDPPDRRELLRRST